LTRLELARHVVCPVLSHHIEILGTLVIHCDQLGFFVKSDERFWRELLDVSAMPLALEKSHLDRGFAATDGWRTLGLTATTAPF
jgi:hypothetical protein